MTMHVFNPFYRCKLTYCWCCSMTTRRQARSTTCWSLYTKPKSRSLVVTYSLSLRRPLACRLRYVTPTLIGRTRTCNTISHWSNTHVKHTLRLITNVFCLAICIYIQRSTLINLIHGQIIFIILLNMSKLTVTSIYAHMHPFLLTACVIL